MSIDSASGLHRAVVLLAVVGILLTTATGVVAAQSFEGAADTVVVEEGETYDRVEGFAGAIVVRGTVTGDVSGAAGTVHVTETGRVGGDVEVAAGTLRIDGRVDGDVSAASGTVVLAETARVGGSVEVGAGYVSIDGRVDGDVRVGGETVELGPNAVVGGSVRYDAETFTRDPRATVGGEVVRDSTVGADAGPSLVDFEMPGWVGVVYGFFADLLLGVVLLAVFPVFSARIATRVAESPVVTGGTGLLSLVAIPLLLVLLVLTLVGIPLAVVGAVGFAVALWVGSVYGQYAVGAWALSRVGRDDRWLALLSGLLGFTVLGLLPILGGLLELGALLLGFGALVLGLREHYRARGGASVESRQATLDEIGGETSTS